MLGQGKRCCISSTCTKFLTFVSKRLFPVPRYREIAWWRYISSIEEAIAYKNAYFAELRYRIILKV